MDNQPPTADQPTLDAILLETIGAVAGRKPLPDEDLFNIFNNSIELLSLAAAIEYELGYRLDLLDLLDHPTPQQLAAHLHSISAPRQTHEHFS